MHPPQTLPHVPLCKTCKELPGEKDAEVQESFLDQYTVKSQSIDHTEQRHQQNHSQKHL